MSTALARRTVASRLLPILVIVLAALLRAVALKMGSGHLADDRDDYLLVARQYADAGFWTPFKRIPNSFRPPLYPLSVAAIVKAGGGPAALGLLQLALGTATVALTWELGRRLGLGLLSAVAAALVALDPLLIEYTTYPMTETLFTFLVILLVTVATPKRYEGPSQGRSMFNVAAVGALFGACVLCRPTIWPVAGLAAACFLWRVWRSGERIGPFLRASVVAGIATAAVVSPWMFRNWKILGSPVMTTTHGGYTLLLGNNTAFFNQVAARPFLREWRDSEPDRFQGPWFRELVQEMDREIGPAAGEMAQDRWMYHRALRSIAAEPRLFLRACLLRLAEFWNVVPLNPSRSMVPAAAVWALGAGYALELVLFVAGLGTLARYWDNRWAFPLLLILNFTLVHLLYWSNMRMRAPLVPLIAIIATRGLAGLCSLFRSDAQPQRQTYRTSADGSGALT